MTHPVTGRMPAMLQDSHRPLSFWLATRIDSKMHAREAAESIWDDARQDAECERVNRMIAARPKVRKHVRELFDLTPGNWIVLCLAGALVAFAFYLASGGGV